MLSEWSEFIFSPFWYQVVINYASSAGAAEEVAKLVTSMGSEAIIVKANVGKREVTRTFGFWIDFYSKLTTHNLQEIDAMFKEVADKWGRVDVLVNNAGEFLDRDLMKTGRMRDNKFA